MIYAIPPAIRITCARDPRRPGQHGRGGRGNGLDPPAGAHQGAAAAGPQDAAPAGVNQTILFALSMVVIAGLIGGKGLGDTVTSGLNSYPALAILAGIVIVIMAIALDRVDRGDGRPHRSGSAARDRRASPPPALAHRSPPPRGRRRCRSPCSPGSWARAPSTPRRTARDWLLARIQSMLDYVENPNTFVFQVTSWIGNHLVQYGAVAVPELPRRDAVVRHARRASRSSPWSSAAGGRR